MPDPTDQLPPPPTPLTEEQIAQAQAEIEAAKSPEQRAAEAAGRNQAEAAMRQAAIDEGERLVREGQAKIEGAKAPPEEVALDVNGARMDQPGR